MKSQGDKNTSLAYKATIKSKALSEESEALGSQRPRGRVPARGVRWRRLWDWVMDRGRNLALVRTGGRNVEVRVQEDVILCAVSKVVEV